MRLRESGDPFVPEGGWEAGEPQCKNLSGTERFRCQERVTEGDYCAGHQERVCPTCDAGDPSSVVNLADCRCPA